MWGFFLIAISLFTFHLGARDTCSEIEALTCSSVVLNDGTGSTKVAPAIDDRITEKLKQKKPVVTKDFLEALKKADPYERDFALAATGAYTNSSCRGVSEGAEFTQACRSVVAEGLADRVIVDLRNGRTQQSDENTFHDLKDEWGLRQTDLYNDVSESHLEQMKKETANPDLEKHLLSLMGQAKRQINAVINQKVQDPKVRHQLKKKITAIQFSGTDCSLGAGGLNAEFAPNAFYFTNNKFYFCKGFENLGLSDFSALWIIAHELSHSIDPCNIQRGPSISSLQYKADHQLQAGNEYPFPSLVNCLRDPRSVGATFAKNPDPPGEFFCKGDQVGEAFCDWMATEVLARHSSHSSWAKLTGQQYKNGIANVMRPFCRRPVGLRHGGGSHPETHKRLNNILLAQPKIRKRLSCSALNPNRKIHCDSKSYTLPQASEAYGSPADNGEVE